MRIGDTVHVITEVAERRETNDPATGLVTQSIEVRNQRDEVVASGRFVTLVARRPREAA